jgi:hypothetical protein
MQTKKITIHLVKSREGFQIEKMTNATVVGSGPGMPQDRHKLGEYITEEQAQRLCDNSAYEVTLTRPK